MKHPKKILAWFIIFVFITFFVAALVWFFIKMPDVGIASGALLGFYALALLLTWAIKNA